MVTTALEYIKLIANQGVWLYSETSLIEPPLGPTMGGSINETLINAFVKENGPLKHVTLLYLSFSM